VLYPGVGRGEEAVVAARLGARVTALDCAPAMLERCRRSRDAAGFGDEELRLVLGDLLTHSSPPGGYDCIAAHFVLNVFTKRDLCDALDHLIRQLAPGGRLVVADFAPPAGGWRGLGGHASYWPVSLAGWALGLAALHAVHDVEAALAPRGFALSRRVLFGPYESSTFVSSSVASPVASSFASSSASSCE
jgi:demethylmenaquinone methyltransferase/2-methoxy-6-polyprenyl-1,4-benzoquinol methylase